MNKNVVNFKFKAKISIKPLIFFFFSLLLYSCNSPSDSPYQPILFVAKTPMSGVGRSSAVAFVIDGKGYVALGRDSSHNPLNDCWEYDSGLDKWTKRASLPAIGRVKGIATVVKGHAYVGLGYKPLIQVYTVDSAYLKDFWEYNPVTDLWIRKTDFPGNDCDACVSFQFGDEIYVGSGFGSDGFNRKFWKYSPNFNSWTQLSDFPWVQRTCAVVCTNGEHVFFGTGFSTFNQNDWWEYFPATDTWKALKSMPDQGRENAVSFSINNRFFVSTGRQFGGDLTGGNVKSDIMEYDLLRNEWYKRGNIPNGNRENAITLVINGKGYIGFGENDTKVLNDFWSFEP
jgi:N-acetylneuraminic acid mutarotase